MLSALASLTFTSDTLIASTSLSASMHLAFAISASRAIAANSVFATAHVAPCELASFKAAFSLPSAMMHLFSKRALIALDISISFLSDAISTTTEVALA